MRVILLISIIKLVFGEEYYYNVNQFHEPLTTYDKVAKTVKYCIYMNNRTLDVDYLLGTWYTIYKFADNIATIGTDYCATTIFTRPTREDLDKYKTKYNLQNETFTFDDGALLSSQQDGKLKGIVVGNKTAKYYFLDPKEAQRLSGMYEVMTYKPVNADYMIYYPCNMRGHIKYLWSRKNDPTDAELAEVVQPLYELGRKQKQRFCMKKKIESTTPYF